VVTVEVLRVSANGKLLELNASFGGGDASAITHPLGNDPTDGLLVAFAVEVLYNAALQDELHQDSEVFHAVERAVRATKSDSAEELSQGNAVGVGADVAAKVAGDFVLRGEQTYRSEGGSYYTLIFLLRQGVATIAAGTTITFPSVVYAYADSRRDTRVGTALRLTPAAADLPVPQAPAPVGRPTGAAVASAAPSPAASRKRRSPARTRARSPARSAAGSALSSPGRSPTSAEHLRGQLSTLERLATGRPERLPSRNDKAYSRGVEWEETRRRKIEVPTCT
jgi:hypothetical protein